MPEKNPFDVPAIPEKNPFDVPARPGEENPFDVPDNRSFYERWMHGTAVGRILEAAGVKAKEGFGDGPIGMDPNGENADILKSLALFTNPEHPRLVDPISAISESLVKGMASLGDIGIRTLEAGAYAAGGATNQAMLEAGSEQGWANRAGNEVTNALNYRMVSQGGASPLIARVRVRATRVGNEIRQEEIGQLPQNPDFENTARAIHAMAPPRGGTRPPAEGMVRMFHGGANYDKGNALDFISQRDYAEEYARKSGGRLQYVDVPEEHPEIAPEYPEQGARQGFTINKKLSVELSDQRKPFQEPSTTIPKQNRIDVTTNKLKALWDEHGLHPAEVLADAQNDPSVARDLRSGSPTLPERYTGYDAARELRLDAMREAQARGGRLGDIDGVSPELNAALKQRITWPRSRNVTEATLDVPEPTTRMQIGVHLGMLIDKLGFGIPGVLRDAGLEFAHGMQMKFTPMAERFAQITHRAAAKDFANYMRVAAYDGQAIDGLISKEFTPEARARMYEAVDAQDAARIQGAKVPPANGLASLSPAERGVANALRRRMMESYKEAGRLGMHTDKLEGGREFYVPRMIAGMEKMTSQNAHPLDQIGGNLRDRTAQLMRRTYKFSSETEQAAKAGFGDNAFLVRDIRTLNLANMKLQQAMAGRKLVNAIEELGKVSGDPSVIIGAVPAGKESQYFTIDNPALRRWRPQTKRGEDGRWMKATFDDDSTAWVSDPINIHRAFEGPLRAVLTAPEWSVYRGVMALKAKAMSYIMFSPLMHFGVIAGRAFPAVKGNPYALGRLYFDGNKVKRDPALMREAISNGLVPIGKWGTKMDIDSIAGTNEIAPGQSIEAQIAGFIPGLFKKEAGDAVKRAIDKAGDFWHNTLLWNRVGDLQMGLYQNYFGDLLSRGFSRDAASKAASHLANRYAGVLPPEAMSPLARQLSNVLLFSRSYTLGNIGSMKDMLVGLPRDVLGQLERDEGVRQMMAIRSYAQRKAISIVALDTALFFAGNAALETGLNLLARDKTLNEEGQNYVKRAQKFMAAKIANPWSILYFPGWGRDVQSLLPGGSHEPGKEDRILLGYQSDGTAKYLRNPTGKTGEDMLHWASNPFQTMANKMNPQIRAIYDMVNNTDYRGHMLYSPHAFDHLSQQTLDAVRAIVWNAMKLHFPSDTIGAGYELATGTPTEDERTLDKWTLIGTATGAMMSRGYPGGPAGGFLFRAKQERQFQIQQRQDEIRKDIREGRLPQAMQIMNDLKMDPKFQRWWIDTTLNPEASFVKRRSLQLMESLEPEDQEVIREHFGEGHKK